MGIVQSLGYEVPTPNGFQRAMWHVSSSRPGAWCFARLLPPTDRLVLRLTGGRVSLPRLAAGIPVVTLVSTGARSGLRRESPLLGVPVGDDLAVIGTKFGQPGTPSWYWNLRARPEAAVAFRGRTVPVVAREAEGEERERIWQRARQIYLGYEAYARRIRDRPVHVMVLSAPDAGPPAS